jgi:hypothetical protein
MEYTIEATGQEGGFAYRYQYKIGASECFGYAESESEALANIKLEQEKADYRERKAKGESIWNTWSYVCSRCDSAIAVTSNAEPVSSPACTCSKNRKQVVLISAGKAGK